MHPINFLVDKMMLPVLQSAFNVTGSYGWAIVFLTVLIRLLLLPLTMQSYYSMKGMQQLQPKLKKIQERYKGKPEELNKQMIGLYREHKVNPLGGCLPMILQMPFLFALYASLIGEKFTAMLAASGNKSFLVLTDLSRMGVWDKGTIHWDNAILLALFAGSTVLQQRTMTPPPSPDADPRQAAIQKQMAFMMPIMITSMFLIIPVPTGIYLYLVISNLIGIAQYAFLNVHSKRREEKMALAQSSRKIDIELDSEDKPVVHVTASAAKSSIEESDSDANQKHRVKKSVKKKKKRK